MITEQLRYFQFQDDSSNSGHLVKATEFRHTDGQNTYSVTVINEIGHGTASFQSRQEAIDYADMYIRGMVEELHKKYFGI